MTYLRLDDPTGSVADAVLVYDYPALKLVYLNLRAKRPKIAVHLAGGCFDFRILDERTLDRLAQVTVDVDDVLEHGWLTTIDVSRYEVYLFLFRMTREVLEAGKRATT